MSLSKFLSEVNSLYRQHGVTGLRAAGQNFTRGLAVRLGMVHDAFGETDTILHEDWDLFILLDACRYDLMKEVEDEYDFLDVTPHHSYASSSQDWLQKTFFQSDCSLSTRISTTLSLFREPYQNDLLADVFEMRDVSDVGYITANPQSPMLNPAAFAHMDEVWQEEWGHNERPRALTNRTIQCMRHNETVDRTIVHYMKPHEPFTAEGRHNDGTVWQRLQRGEVSFETVWDSYRENLRDVLDEVELLLTNVDAERVIISADHGNSLGEYGMYGHRPYLPFDGMRAVPRVTTTASDEGTHQPDVSQSNQEHQSEELLEDLGYL